MKLTAILIVLLHLCTDAYSQGVTLLYKSPGGWNNSSSWIQLNAPAGQSPIQRVPTELDNIVFSKSMSGLDIAHFSFKTGDSIVIGGTNSTGYRCRSMRISNMNITFNGEVDYAASLHVYTNNGGQIRIDSGGNMIYGLLTLHGGSDTTYDMEVIDSKYGTLFTHGVWSSVTLLPKGRAKFVNSSCEGWGFKSYSTGGEIYAENSTFMTPTFVLGDSSKATILDCKIVWGNNFNSVNFGIGRGADFFSRNVEIEALDNLFQYTSGSVINGNITTKAPQGGLRLQQKDPAHPLPNIINGNLKIFGQGLDLSGDLKLSGDLINTAVEQEMYPDSSHVYINGQHIFKIGGIANFGNDVSTKNCTQPGCHFKLELFGDMNSNIEWPVGFPVDTLVINKSNCAKVTFENSLYVSRETRIQGGQLVLNPNGTIPYKFVSAGDVNISKGGGLFLRRNASGVVANMAVAGDIYDQNTVVDSTCRGLSNPYSGTVALYKSPLNPGNHTVVLASNASIGDIKLIGENGQEKQLGGDLTVNNFTFINPGKLLLGNHQLTINGTLSGYGPSNYFVTNGTGKLLRTRIGNSETVFPVGPSAASYNPITITNAGTPDDFRVNIKAGVLLGGTTGSPYTTGVVNRTWNVEEAIAGGSNATIKLQWNAADELSGFARTAAYLSHFSSGAWDNNPALPAAGSGPFSLSRSSLTSFSPFAVFSTIVNSVNGPTNRDMFVFPNPCEDWLYVQLPASFSKTSLQLLDSKGIVLQAEQVKAGATMAKIPTSFLSAGVYWLVIWQGARKETIRFVRK